MLSRCFLDFSVGVRASSCHRAESDLFLFSQYRNMKKVKYKPGKLMFMADHLSRSFLPETKETLIPDVEVNSISPATYLPLSQERYLELQQNRI